MTRGGIGAWCLLVAGMLFGAIAAQHLWVVRSSPVSSGTPGTHQVAMVPVDAIPRNAFDKTANENAIGYVRRVTNMVHLSTFNCEPQTFRLSWLDRVAIHLNGAENIFSQGILVKRRFACGFCHQRAYLVHRILHRNGVDSEVYGLNGHVVTRVKVGNDVYYTDPDYGVGPFSASQDQLDERVRYAYGRAASGNLDLLTGIYLTANDNVPYGNSLDAFHDKQKAVFTASRMYSYVFFLAAVLCLATCVLMTNRPSQTHRLRSSQA